MNKNDNGSTMRESDQGADDLSPEDPVNLGFERLFDCLAANVTLGSCPRKSLGRNNDDHIWRSNTLVEVSPGVEETSLSDDLLLELGVVHVSGRLDEHDR